MTLRLLKSEEPGFDEKEPRIIRVSVDRGRSPLRSFSRDEIEGRIRNCEIRKEEDAARWDVKIAQEKQALEAFDQLVAEK